MTTPTPDTLSPSGTAIRLWKELPPDLRMEYSALAPLVLNLLSRAYREGARWGFAEGTTHDA